MEDFEGKDNDYFRAVTLIRKDQKVRIQELLRKGVIKKFNLSAFVRVHLDKYLEEKEKGEVKE